jgi:site-specific DNA-methyltransferase (adenine-specific)
MFVDIFNTDKKYNIIYADPPWKYVSKQPFRSGGVRFHTLEEEYPTVSTSEMCKWDVGRITAQDCALFMWATDSHVEEAIQLMKAWGFKYVTIAFIWAKQTNKGNQVSNLGAWTMKNCEICLFGTKGTMKKYKKSNSVRQLFYAERTKHSKKPACVRSFIEELFGDLPKIELFARQHAEGWDCWGNEV